jgi:hypothetical protein
MSASAAQQSGATVDTAGASDNEDADAGVESGVYMACAFQSGQLGIAAFDRSLSGVWQHPEMRSDKLHF